jgi:general secretion pathway protein D
VKVGNMKGKRMNLKWICLAAIAPAIAMGQVPGGSGFDFGGGTKTDKPWTEFHLNTKTRVKLQLANATPAAVVKFFENESGVTIVLDPSLTGTLAITSARAVPLSEAFEILSATLGLKGYNLSKQGNLLIIKQNGAAGGRTQGAPDTAGGFPTGGNENTSVPRLYVIKYANASQLARVLNDVYAPVAGQQNNNFQFQRGGNNQRNFGGGFAGFGQQQQPTVKASSDDFSNSVIVNAPESIQGQLKDLISKLDMPADLPQRTKVYALKYANAQDMVSIVQNVLTANVPRGKGGATTGQQQGPAAFFSAIRGQTAGAGQVVADNRTNSLVVTATDDDLKIVDQVVQNVDHDVTVQSTTFVFPLQNARADAVATIIQQAYGNKQGVSAPNTTLLQNTQGTINKAAGGNGITNTTTTNRTGVGADDLSNDPTASLALALPGSGLSAPQALPDAATQKKMLANGQTNLPIKLADPNAQSGDLLTSIAVTQGFGGGQFRGGGGNSGGQSSNGSSTTYTTGVSDTGEIVRTRDLTGQITAIPDINSNSIIVVASPEYAAIVKQMIQQLDKIPEQVMIQTVIVEASLDSSTKLGVEWNLASSLSKILGDPTATGTGGTNFGIQSGIPGTTPGFTYAISGKNFTSFLQALQTDNKFQILATPRIFTTNNVQADINVSQSIPYVTSVQSDSAGNPTYSYAFLSVGIILTIQPRIMTNGYVTMDIDQTANELEGYVNVGNVSAPEVNQREATTTVSVKDGETIILGGIIQKTITATTNKIPLLGDIPILGNLFKYTSKDTNHTELLVFMTPHVVSNIDDARKLAKDSLNELTKPVKSDVETDKSVKENLGGIPIKP